MVKFLSTTQDPSTIQSTKTLLQNTNRGSDERIAVKFPSLKGGFIKSSTS
jgi:hypothetical protein